MLKPLIAATLFLALPLQAFAADSFTKCENHRNAAAFARHAQTATEVTFSSMDECRNQLEGGFNPQVVCGCAPSISGAQVFLAIFTGGASIAAHRQWTMEVKCHKFDGQKINVVKSVDFGIYDVNAANAGQILNECKAAEKILFSQLNAGV